MIGTISSLRGPSYPIPYSLRFRSSASAYLSRTLSTPTNNLKWTWSGWVKRGVLSSGNPTLFSGMTSGINYTAIFLTTDAISFSNRPSAGVNGQLIASNVLRDPSAWYHIVAVFDSANTTSSDRMILYVNGVRVTSFTTSTYPTPSGASIANSAISHYVGADGTGNYFDGYLAEVHFVDGQALTPASFGNISSATGVWAPKKYTGTYGTNGFYLKFADNSAASATAIGKDSSGNSNNWTPTNISMVAGSTFDSMTDTPTPYGDAAYYSGWNPSYGLQFRSSASTYLSRTPAAASNRKTWTWSGWVRRRSIGSAQVIFEAGNPSGTAIGDLFIVQFNSSNAIRFDIPVVGISTTTATFSNTSSWYHIVVAVDTTQATATNRTILYVDGVQQTFSLQPTITPSADLAVNNTVAHYHGRYDGSISYFDGVLADINFIDGQALTPAAFAETDGTGTWVPKAYTGTYGTNGFYLNFADRSAMTAATIGNDASSNSNNWQPNNMAISDAIDYGVRSVRGNYAVLNAVSTIRTPRPNSGNLDQAAGVVGDNILVNGSIAAAAGKWYFELTAGSSFSQAGVSTGQHNINGNMHPAALGSFAYVYHGNGLKYNNGTSASYGNTFTANDVIGVALDLDNGKLFFAKNNTWQASGDPVAGTNAAFTSLTGTLIPCVGAPDVYATGTVNFGQRPFAYTPPAGFKALCTHNLPVPTIKKAASYMAATTYTGTGVGRTITNTVNNTSFQPDLVWIKGRSGATDHALYDSVRGTTKDIASNSFGVETTQSTGLTAFGANGFDIGALAKLNTNAATYVAWQWKAGVGVVTNTAGSITSQVNANPTTGFSIVTYTGTGANATVGHGLGVTPSMVLVKNLTGTTSANWRVWHSSLAGVSYFLGLNQTTAAFTNTTVFNGFNSTNFTIGTDPATNESGRPLVAYCFAEIAGYSKFGSYTGNGLADGPFCFTGFRPRWVMVKRTDTTADWVVYDTTRNASNLTTQIIEPSQSLAEITGTGTVVDLLSNGFKARGAGLEVNITNATYIFAAFAEVPSKYALAR